MWNRILLLTALTVLLPGTLLAAQNVWPDPDPHPGFGNPVSGDLDGDGDLDLLLNHHGWGLRLWRNDHPGGWTDVTPQSFDDLSDPHGMAMGDYDEDGDLDIFVTVGAGGGSAVGKKHDKLFRNDGGLSFTDVGQALGVHNPLGRGRAASWIDIEGDGDLDLFVQNFDGVHVLYRNEGGGTFSDRTTETRVDEIPHDLYLRALVDLNQDGLPDLLLGGHGNDAYFENTGGAFRDATAEVGLPPVEYARCLATGDYDNDGDLDLFVARGFPDKKNRFAWSPDRLRFSDVAADREKGVDIQATGSLSFGLYALNQPATDERDVHLGAGLAEPTTTPFVLSPSDPRLVGRPGFDPASDTGIYIWRESGEWRVRWMAAEGSPYLFGEIVPQGGSIQDASTVGYGTPMDAPWHDNLYRNDAGRFVDVTEQAGIPTQIGDNTWGCAWADFDADGWLDLYIVRAGTRVDGDAPDRLLLGQANGRFRNASGVVPTGKALAVGNGHGAAVFDFDDDMDPDLFVKQGNGDPVPGAGRDYLFRNPTGGRRVTVRLEPTVSPPGAVGARVIATGGGMAQLHEVWGAGGGSNYGQGGHRPVHFGMGPLTRIPRITVYWPSGRVQIFENVRAGTEVVAVEPLAPGLGYRLPGDWDPSARLAPGSGPEASEGLERIR